MNDRERIEAVAKEFDDWRHEVKWFDGELEEIKLCDDEGGPDIELDAVLGTAVIELEPVSGIEIKVTCKNESLTPETVRTVCDVLTGKICQVTREVMEGDR